MHELKFSFLKKCDYYKNHICALLRAIVLIEISLLFHAVIVIKCIKQGNNSVCFSSLQPVTNFLRVKLSLKKKYEYEERDHNC